MKVLISLIALGFCSCSPQAPQAGQSQSVVSPAAFDVESSCEISGYVTVKVIRHLETGRRYILASYGGGGLQMTPIDQAPATDSIFEELRKNTTLTPIEVK